jgi:hypothetical protein
MLKASSISLAVLLAVGLLTTVPFEAQPDPEYVALERQLRAVANRLEIEAEIETRIAASRAIGDEKGHVAWLKEQLETAAIL